MEIALILLVFSLIVGGAFLLFGFVVFVRALLAPLNRSVPRSGYRQGLNAQTSEATGMTAEDEGHVHSGPYGYSPMTPYLETQYGSLFNPDAEWNHEERD